MCYALNNLESGRNIQSHIEKLLDKVSSETSLIGSCGFSLFTLLRLHRE